LEGLTLLLKELHMYTDFVVDLETLALNPAEPTSIVQIGVVGLNRFDLDVPFVHFNGYVNKEGGYSDEETVNWWKETNPEYYNFLMTGAPYFRALKDTLSYLKAFILANTNTKNLKGVWGNGVAFDNAFLRSAEKYTGVTLPWTFREDLCLRTALALFPRVKECKEAAMCFADNSFKHAEHWHYHNAHYDALYEAVMLKEVFGELNETVSRHNS